MEAHSETLSAWCSAWRPRDRRSAAEWGEQYIEVPGAARSRKFSQEATPHLREVFEFHTDPHVREKVVLMPTGAGKTTIFDVCIPHSIAEDPASIALYLQGNKEAEGHMEDRLLPTLRNCEPVAHLMAALNRHSIRKGAVIFPNMSLYVKGLNKTNTQRISARDVYVDEAWLAIHGLIENARARMHNRWNRRFTLASQGGNQFINIGKEKMETELFAAWDRTDKREWSMVCPECGAVTPWKLINLKFADSDNDREVIESAQYHCPSCPAIFEDKPEVRRSLSSASRYVVTNPNHKPHHHGWHAPAVGLFHEEWGELALAWKKANQSRNAGDFEPFKIFITKRLAEFYAEAEDNPDVVLGASGYTLPDYLNGESIEGEAILPIGGRARFATIDKQQVGFWMAVRAFRADGSSRLLFFNFLTTIEECREVQKRYGVIDAFTAEDASHMPDEAFLDCLKYGWTPMFGDKRYEFLHEQKNKKPIRKPYSVLLKAQASSGQIVRYLRWSNERIKDILFRHVAGLGPKFEVPDDIGLLPLKPGQEYHRQLSSEVKRDVIDKLTKAVTKRWIKTRKNNHAVDLECMLKVFAIIKGVAGISEMEIIDAEEDLSPNETSTTRPA